MLFRSGGPKGHQGDTLGFGDERIAGVHPATVRQQMDNGGACDNRFEREVDLVHDNEGREHLSGIGRLVDFQDDPQVDPRKG